MTASPSDLLREATTRLDRLTADAEAGALNDAQDAGRNLAQQVAERTRALQDINTKLHDEAAQRKQIEDALRESEARLQAAISIETVGVLFFNLDGSMVDANGAFEHMSGYSREDLRAGRLQAAS